MTPPRYPYFDWLRFVLASVVALGHAGVIGWSNATNLAVQVFFALSGWLIGGILLRSNLKDLPHFFFNRATRIWIPYFFAVALLYALSTLRDPITQRWSEFLFYDLTFTHNWFSLFPDFKTALAEMPLQGTGNHFWSISVEEQFYLAAPLMIMMLWFGRHPLFWIAVSALLYVLTVDFSSISLGVLAASVRARIGDWHLRPVAVVAIFAATSAALGTLLVRDYYWQAAPFVAVGIVLLTARPGIRSTVGMFAGGISYPMYLNHWVGVFAANVIAKYILILPPIGTAWLGYFGGVAAGAIAYLAIDRVVMARRDEYFSPRIGLLLAVTGFLLVACGISFGAIRWWLLV